MTNSPCKELSMECTLKISTFTFSTIDELDYKKGCSMDDNCHIINRNIINIITVSKIYLEKDAQ